MEDVAVMKVLRRHGVTLRAIAEEFDCSAASVCRILKTGRNIYRPDTEEPRTDVDEDTRGRGSADSVTRPASIAQEPGAATRDGWLNRAVEERDGVTGSGGAS